MYLFVLAIGALIIAGSVAMIVAPGTIKGILSVFLEKGWIWVAAVGRIVIGVLFIFAAADTRSPTYITIVGAVIVLAGLVLAIMGTERTKAFVGWWMAKPDAVMRLVALAGLVFGASLIWAAT